MEKTNTREKRAYISQADVPSTSLSDALRVARAIADNYGKKPTKPLHIAQAMGLQPSSSYFRMLTGASIAYGLTEGGYNATQIGLTSLGRSIVAPTSEGADSVSMKDALLKPNIIRQFLEKYNDSAVPSEKIGINVLEEMGVPPAKAASTFRLIMDSAGEVGLLCEVKGKLYVSLENSANTDSKPLSTELEIPQLTLDNPATQTDASVPTPYVIEKPTYNNRVFITHGKNREFIDPLKKLLEFGGFEPIVSIEKESLAQPLTEKVMGDMRSCGAAIIHIEDEKVLVDAEGARHVMLNQNVLIEIGAALALYQKKFILLVKNGVQVPSNLQGLYEVRYTGDTLDGDVTLKLMGAIGELKKYIPK